MVYRKIRCLEQYSFSTILFMPQIGFKLVRLVISSPLQHLLSRLEEFVEKYLSSEEVKARISFSIACGPRSDSIRQHQFAFLMEQHAGLSKKYDLQPCLRHEPGRTDVADQRVQFDVSTNERTGRDGLRGAGAALVTKVKLARHQISAPDARAFWRWCRLSPGPSNLLRALATDLVSL
jgi:hypothetical protein